MGSGGSTAAMKSLLAAILCLACVTLAREVAREFEYAAPLTPGGGDPVSVGTNRTSLSPLGGALLLSTGGGLGGGGSNCEGPIYCRAPSGQCCKVVGGPGGRPR